MPNQNKMSVAVLWLEACSVSAQLVGPACELAAAMPPKKETPEEKADRLQQKGDAIRAQADYVTCCGSIKNKPATVNAVKELLVRRGEWKVYAKTAADEKSLPHDEDMADIWHAGQEDCEWVAKLVKKTGSRPQSLLMSLVSSFAAEQAAA